MKLDRTQMKAYAGGVSGGAGVVAGVAIVEYVNTIIAWLLSFIDPNAPPQVAFAFAVLLVTVGGFFGGKALTFWFPPNEPSVEIVNGGEDDLLSGSKRQYL